MSFFTSLLGGISTALGVIPGLQPLASGLSSIFGYETASDQLEDERNWASNEAQKNRDFQKSERLETQAFNLDMWNKNNQYNSPAEQLKRLEAAGINPNAAVAGVSNPANSSPVTSSPMSGSMASTPASIAGQLLMSDAQIANLMANTRKADAEADATEYGTNWNKKTEDIRLENMINSNSKYKAEAVKIMRDVAHIEFDEDMQRQVYSWMSKKNEQEINIMLEQLNLLRNQSIDIIQRLGMDKEQLSANIRKINNDIYQSNRATSADVDLKSKQSDYYSSLTSYNDQLTDNAEAMQPGIEADSDLKNLMLEFSNSTGIPFGTDVTTAMFSLWMQGRIDDFMDYSMIASANHPNKSWTDYFERSLLNESTKIRFPKGQQESYFRSSPKYMNTVRQRYGYFYTKP